MIDSHAHVGAEQFEGEREQVYKRAIEAGLSGWIEVGTTVTESKQAIVVAEQFEGVHATVGVHPSDISGITEHDWQELESLMSEKKVKAVGEVGFDFYRGGDLAEQKKVLQRFITLANSKNLPVIFHVRDGKDVNAHDELIKLLEALPVEEKPRGVIHTFSGTKIQADRYLNLGLYLSFSGVVTFKNAGEVATVAATMPIDRILIETDCPYLTPDPYRGKRNEPAFVAYVARKIAELRNDDVVYIQEKTAENTNTLFQL